MSSAVFRPIPLRDVTIPNRIVLSPMCQHSTDGDGLATDWHLVHLGSRAVGGAGAVMTEATAVEPRGRISRGDLGIWSTEHAEALNSITGFIKKHGSVPGIQLAHSGRKGSTARPWNGGHPLQPDEGGWETLAPTHRPYPYDTDPPETRMATTEDIEAVIDAFGKAAALADEAGFEIVEIHAAHGYLLHEFLSPVTNDRTDRYGGSFENRTRLLREICTRVRQQWPETKPLSVRISATDWLPDRNAWTVEQSVRLAEQLTNHGVDILDVSARGLHPEQRIPETGPRYQLPLAERIKSEMNAEISIGTVGSITTAEGATEIISNGRADLVFIGREHLRNPYFTLDIARKVTQTDRIDSPVQYRRAFW